MNKKTTFLSLIGLATVAGAGYFYTSGQDINKVPQQVGQYLPEAVLDYLPESFSPEVPVIVDEVAPESDLNSEETETTETNVASESQNDAAEQADTSHNVVSDIMSDIEQEVADASSDQTADQNDSANDVADAVKSDSVVDKNETIADNSVINDPKASKEAQELQKQIAEVNSKLSQLDSEKENLENKFQNVLKQNRTLAIKLKEIDEQLKSNMK